MPISQGNDPYPAFCKLDAPLIRAQADEIKRLRAGSDPRFLTLLDSIGPDRLRSFADQADTTTVATALRLLAELVTAKAMTNRG